MRLFYVQLTTYSNVQTSGQDFNRGSISTCSWEATQRRASRVFCMDWELHCRQHTLEEIHWEVLKTRTFAFSTPKSSQTHPFYLHCCLTAEHVAESSRQSKQIWVDLGVTLTNHVRKSHRICWGQKDVSQFLRILAPPQQGFWWQPGCKYKSAYFAFK